MVINLQLMSRELLVIIFITRIFECVTFFLLEYQRGQEVIV